MLNLLNLFHPDDICPRCEILTTPRSVHCRICDKCVEGFDHHCPWINNCVGAKNRNVFFIFILTLTLVLVLNIEPPITAAFLTTEEGDVDGPSYTPFCLLCQDEDVLLSVFTFSLVAFLCSSLIVTLILVDTFRKFVNDYAQIEEEEGNQISQHEQPVNNRIGKTVMTFHKAQENLPNRNSNGASIEELI